MTLLKKHQFGPRDLSNSTQAASLDAAPIDAPLPSPASAPVAPIRSLFFAKQGAATDRIAGARADAVVLDLEDSVKPADRPAARGWINDLLRDGDIAKIEDNCIIKLDPSEMPADATAQGVSQALSWGLDRIDSRSGTDGSYDNSGATGEGALVCTCASLSIQGPRVPSPCRP